MDALNPSTDLDPLPFEERTKFCYCKPGQTHCGECMVCGKPGHIRPLMFFTGTWCDACFRLELKRVLAEG